MVRTRLFVLCTFLTFTALSCAGLSDSDKSEIREPLVDGLKDGLARVAESPNFIGLTEAVILLGGAAITAGGVWARKKIKQKQADKALAATVEKIED